jgi:alpha-amylase/alpha-mannosidase (GH57 family)
MPYLCKLPSGRTINLFFYDGPISQEIAFGELLTSGERFASRLLSAFTEEEGPQLVHIATDGETYGHHHRHGDMALAYAIHHIEANNLARITNYGEFLEKHPPTHEVEIVQNSSWSCGHGIERWRSNCGCNTGRADWNQEWRGPLRDGLNWLRDALAPIYESEMSALARDPWRARDEYIDVILDRSTESVEWFLSRHAARELKRDDKVSALRLLEMQRHAQLMFTSCGWFFDEVSGLEGVQVLMYAARAIQLAEKVTGANLEPEFLELIRNARSNVAEHQDGAWVYEHFVKPASIDLLRVGAHYGVSSLFEDYRDETQVYCYSVDRQLYGRHEAGRQKLAAGMAHMRSNITWAESDVSFAVVHLGDHNLMGGVREFISAEEFASMQAEIKEAFQRSDIPRIIHLMDEHFRAHSYSLWHLFRDEQRRVFARILASTLAEVEVSYRRIYDHHYPIMQVMRELSTPIPKAFVTAAEFTMNAELRNLIEDESPDRNRLRELVSDIKRWSFEIDKTTLAFLATNRVNILMDEFMQNPEGLDLVEKVETLIDASHALGLDIDLWKAQNHIFSINSQVAPSMRERARSEDQLAARWLEHINKVSEQMGVRSA